jgi:nucleoside-diphosphate-sugar epimerase
MKVLVTGGTGFIGSHLVERLCAGGDEVVCVAKDPLNIRLLESLGCTVVLADLNNGLMWDSVLDGVEQIYHVAGVTRARDPGDYYEGNTLATRRFVEICSDSSLSLNRFVYISSLAAAGPSPDGHPLQENAPPHPVSAYGKSKLLAEREVMRAQDRLPVTIVRPAMVYGPRERDMYDYMRMVKRGIRLLIGFHQKVFSLIHVQDLVQGVLLAGNATASVGGTYFLGSERFYTTGDIGKAMSRVLHRHTVGVCIPHAVVYAVGAISEAIGKITGRNMLFNSEKVREVVQPSWTCSVAKAREVLGFRQRIDLEEGMRQTYRWYCANGWM